MATIAKDKSFDGLFKMQCLWMLSSLVGDQDLERGARAEEEEQEDHKDEGGCGEDNATAIATPATDT
jgi:hypothetical protein